MPPGVAPPGGGQPVIAEVACRWRGSLSVWSPQHRAAPRARSRLARRPVGPGHHEISARHSPHTSRRGQLGSFYLFIFISFYLIYGFTLDTRDSIHVNFKYYLILQTRPLMLAVIRGGPLSGCQMEMRVDACAASACDFKVAGKRHSGSAGHRGVKRLS